MVYCGEGVVIDRIISVVYSSLHTHRGGQEFVDSICLDYLVLGFEQL